LPVESWHTYVPHELRAQKLDASNWAEQRRQLSNNFGYGAFMEMSFVPTYTNGLKL
jgi:hypothetical protein